MARKLLMLNGIAISSVILFHAAGWGFTAMFFWTHRYLPVTAPNFDQLYSAPYYALRLIEQLVQFALPTFLFVSGYFIAFLTGRSKTTISWKIVASRVKFLAIPYLLWSTVVILASVLLEGARYSPASLLRMLLIGGSNPAYYFVPLLIQFYIISPVLVWLVKKALVPTLVVTALIQLLVYILQYPVSIGTDHQGVLTLASLFPKWFFMMRIFWFTAGIAAGFHLAAIKNTAVKFRKPLLLGLAVLFVTGFFEWENIVLLSGQPWIETRETLVDALYGATFILLFLSYADLSIPNGKALEFLGNKSFGIYLVHSPVMEFVSRGFYHLAPWILGSQILLQPILIAAGLGVPLLLMYLVNRSPARSLYIYQFG